MRTSRSDDLGRAVATGRLTFRRSYETRHEDDSVTGRCGRNDPSRIINALVARRHITAGCVARVIASHIGTNPETQHLMLGGELEGATTSGSSGPCRGSAASRPFTHPSS